MGEADTATKTDRVIFPLVVKVGGSLAETGRLPSVLSMLANAKKPLVVVPGGGVFADKVRDLQRAVGFDDQAAHRLAMLGMHQMADTFVEIEPRLVVVDTHHAIADIHRIPATPVWVPLPTLDGDMSVPQNWDTTSDTIAARLALLLGGAPLVLLKSIDPGGEYSAEKLGESGVVDRAFADFVGQHDIAWRVVGPRDLLAFEAELESL